MGKSYLLPVAGNPDPKQMTYLKHPLQDFLRRVLGGWVMVKLERNQQALIITGYDGPKERLYDAISRKAQVHARTTGIALDVSHLEEIVEGRDVQPAIETDETLRMDIEVLYSLLSDESKQREEAEKQHREELSKAEGQLKFVVRERDSAREQCEPLQKKLSGADKANRGLATNYLREKQRPAISYRVHYQINECRCYVGKYRYQNNRAADKGHVKTRGPQSIPFSQFKNFGG